MKRQVNRWWCLSVVLCLCLACSANPPLDGDTESPVHHLVVLHTNDSHGHPVKFTMHSAPGVGGLPARATLVHRIRQEEKNVLLLDAGDINTGTAVSNLFKARPDIEGYNYIGYDAFAIGNHEFDHPTEVLREQMGWARFPFLSANIKTRDGRYFAEPFIIKQAGGLKVAIFGLTTKTTATIGNPMSIKDLVFEDEVDVARELVPGLRKQADVVIALVHMGIYASPERGSKRLAAHVGGIDIIVDGHSHTRLEAPVLIKNLASDHETIIVQAWKWGLILGRVDLWVQNGGIVDYKFEAMPVNLKGVGKPSKDAVMHPFIDEEIQEDETLLALLQPYVDAARSAQSEIIGHAEETFHSAGAREREIPLGDMIADAMFWFAESQKVDLAVQNGGGIRADLAQGPIRIRSVSEVLPFGNTVVVLTLKGSDLQSFFDYIAALPEDAGAFPQVSAGVHFTINRLTGKCEDVLVNDKPIDVERTYRIATNSYLANGGDGYKMFLKATDKYESSEKVRDVLIKYIKSRGGTVKPQEGKRIRIVNRVYGHVVDPTTDLHKMSRFASRPRIIFRKDAKNTGQEEDAHEQNQDRTRSRREASRRAGRVRLADLDERNLGISLDVR